MEQILKDFIDNNEASDAYVTSKVTYISLEDVQALLKKQKEQLILFGVINWVAIKDYLPTKDDDYLVCEDGFVFDAGYSKEYKGFHDHITTRYKDVTHWAELPKPPCL
ncbi:MAG: DUF551 domain-containing protein [Proteobacteria bacterium]|nr:DUF551 domain-containing protein [Pseudomonadota bacterium]